MHDQALLIHGGIAERIGADQFWKEPGILSALTDRQWASIAPDRNTCPPSWRDAADEMAEFVDEPVCVIGGCNGVSVALRLALDHPELVARLVLLWPATCGDPRIDNAVPEEATHLLDGDAVRGVGDAELKGIAVPVAIMPSEPENLFHQHHTVERLLRLIPEATRIRGFPESPRPEFAPFLDQFTDTLVETIR